MHTPLDRFVRILVALGALAASSALWWPSSAEATRIKEVASVQGVQNAVWENVEHPGEGGQTVVTREFKSFEPGVAGSITPAQYDEFVRDTVNFLQYVGDPTQVKRESLGVWVVLFLLAFTGIAYLLKKEYWKDVR